MHDTENMHDENSIECNTLRAGVHSRFLNQRQLAFVSAWTGNLIGAARAAGYADPKAAAYKLMRDPHVVEALRVKQEAMLQESGEHLARALPLSRVDVIDRLWQLAQMSPGETSNSISGQVRATQALAGMFALDLGRLDVLRRELQERSEPEIEFFVVHGYFPQPPPEPSPSPAAQLAAGSTEEQVNKSGRTGG